MNVSEHSVYLARELQRCRPDLGDEVMAGRLTTREALRIAKPEKYGRRNKVEQGMASFRAWDDDSRARAITLLAAELNASDRAAA